MKLGMHTFWNDFSIHSFTHSFIHSFKLFEHLLCARHILVSEETAVNKTHKDLGLKECISDHIKITLLIFIGYVAQLVCFKYILLFLFYSLYIAILIRCVFVRLPKNWINNNNQSCCSNLSGLLIHSVRNYTKCAFFNLYIYTPSLCALSKVQ